MTVGIDDEGAIVADAEAVAIGLYRAEDVAGDLRHPGSQSLEVCGAQTMRVCLCVRWECDLAGHRDNSNWLRCGAARPARSLLRAYGHLTAALEGLPVTGFAVGDMQNPGEAARLHASGPASCIGSGGTASKHR